jgi:hypothetical protein
MEGARFDEDERPLKLVREGRGGGYALTEDGQRVLWHLGIGKPRIVYRMPR